MPSEIKLFNEDCLPAMRKMKDKQFDLAIVDPPYGIEDKISIGGGSHTKSCVKFHQLYSENHKTWDIAPTKEYFNELIRVSKNQIIFGANYFEMKKCRCFIFWDKCVDVPNFSAGEYAWTSFDKPALKITLRNTVEIAESIRNNERIHPTQKPEKLYIRILKHFAKSNDKILDTHLGSGSIAIACYDMGFDLTGYEIDKDYFDAAVKRLENHKKQMVLF